MKPYAVTDATTRGREYPEPASPADPFDIDYHRVLHCTAFRRLKYKTQVFVIGEHDHFRTRLTHTLAVAEVARRLCTALAVNPMVGELIALAHDLGHPPFGHAGEAALAELLADHGGFEHNAQSLRVVDYLEHPYPAFRGLNLNYEIRESLAKHCTIYDRPGAHPLADGSQAPLEGQIANLADRVAYDGHDLEDAIGAGLVDEHDLSAVRLWRMAADPVRCEYPEHPLPAVRRPILDRLEEFLLADVEAEARRRLAVARPATIDDLRSCPSPMVDLSEEMALLAGELETFLRERVYRHSRLEEMDRQARDMIIALYNVYLDDTSRLPERYQRRIAEQGPPRVIADYLAGMTDRFCEQQYAKLH